MTYIAAAAAAGLRERKKRRTRETIAAAALELFARQGYDATTIADVAEAAEVAPRTVSGYFPAKEDLLFPDQEETLALFERLLAERGEDEMAPVALQAWVRALFEGWRGQEETLRARRCVVEANAGLQVREAAFWGRFQELLTAAIAADLGSAPDALEPRMAAASATAVLAVLRDDLDPAKEAAADLAEIEAEVLARLDQAVVFMSAGIRALRDGPR
ncbi:MAG: TetR family transcriptional regulator [Solirubrobacterales bacterium]|nr:TetR family transcriptional regulator [Solirubrobacterales bacterium]